VTGYTLTALREEVAHLPDDLASLAPAIGAQVDALLAVEPVPHRIVLSGSGDSLFAAEAAAYAFSLAAPDGCLVRSTHQLRDYGVPAPSAAVSPSPLVVGISASGGSVGLANGLARARSEGHRTLAVVGCADSPVGRSADRVVVATLPNRPPSPGVRSYQASLLTLLLLAGWCSAARPSNARFDAGGAVALAGVVAETVRRQADPCRQLAERLRETRVVQVLGGGPSFGTARYAAAKLIEGAGVPALGQDPEEWWHVERFATDGDAPLIVLAPPGRSHDRVVRLCAQARDRGHHVAVLARAEDTAVEENSHLVLPLPDSHPAIWSPLVEHLFAAPLAAELAELLGRHPFHRR
jgi:glucosamine--fructose-6-phosphate aminotransferase (isomerizing)